MKDKDKTQKQPPKELTQLRRRVADLEQSETAGKKTEEELKASQMRFALAAQSASDLIWEWDIPTGRLEWFGPIDKFLGYAPGKFPRTIKAWEKAIHPNDHDRVMAALDQHLKEQTPYNEEYRVRRKDGTYRYWIDRGTAQRDSKSNLLKMVGSCTDITARKQAEEALRESEERYRVLFEEARDGIALADADTGILLDCNRALADLIGRNRAELIGQHQAILHPPSGNNTGLSSTFKKHLTNKEGQVLETQVLTMTGEIREVEIKANLLDLQGRKVLQGLFHDITERKKAEDALRESETKFRTLFEAIPDSILVHDDKGTILHVNEISAQQLEWSVKDLVGRNLREIVTPENRATIADHIRETHKIGWSRFETTYVSRSGWKIMTEVNERPIKIGKEKAILSVARDITERKEAAKALVREKNFSTAVINSSPGLLFVFDEKGNIIQWNSNAENVTGYSASEIAKKNVLEFVAEEDIETAAEAIQNALTKGQASVEINLLSKSGGRIPFYIIGLRTKIENTNCIVCTGIDITERKLAENELRKFKTISDKANYGITIVDLEGNVSYVNTAFARMHGHTPDELIGKHLSVFHTEQQMANVNRLVEQLNREGSYVAKEVWHKKNDNSEFPTLMSGTLIKDETGNPLFMAGTAIDITERKEAEGEVKRSYKQLRETLISMVDALAATVEMKDRYTAGHQPRVTRLACAIAAEMGVPAEQIESIRMAASIHDIGKIMVPAEILSKPGPLTEIQYEMIKMHPQAGYDILKGIKFPWPVAEIVLQHHEMIDGSGYPRRLAGKEIMQEARILAVANVVEAMTSHRPYRPAFDIKEALAEISKNRGILYDATVVDACVKLFAEKAFAFV